MLQQLRATPTSSPPQLSPRFPTTAATWHSPDHQSWRAVSGPWQRGQCRCERVHLPMPRRLYSRHLRAANLQHPVAQMERNVHLALTWWACGSGVGTAGLLDALTRACAYTPPQQGQHVAPLGLAFYLPPDGISGSATVSLSQRSIKLARPIRTLSLPLAGCGTTRARGAGPRRGRRARRLPSRRR